MMLSRFIKYARKFSTLSQSQIASNYRGFASGVPKSPKIPQKVRSSNQSKEHQTLSSNKKKINNEETKDTSQQIIPEIIKQNIQSNIKSENNTLMSDIKIISNEESKFIWPEISTQEMQNMLPIINPEERNNNNNPKNVKLHGLYKNMIDHLINKYKDYEKSQKYIRLPIVNQSESAIAKGYYSYLLKIYSDQTKDQIISVFATFEQILAYYFKIFENPDTIKEFLENRWKIYNECAVPISSQLYNALSGFMKTNSNLIYENLIIYLLCNPEHQPRFLLYLSQIEGQINQVYLENSPSEILDAIYEIKLESAWKKDLSEAIIKILAMRLTKGELSSDLEAKYKNAFTPNIKKENLDKLLRNPDKIVRLCIENKSIASILKTGLEVYKDNYNELRDTVLKHIYELFFSRLNYLEPDVIVEVLETLMKTCYYFEDKNKIHEICKDYLNSHPSNKACFSLIKFIWDSTAEANTEIFDKYKDIIENFHENTLNTAILLSQTNLDFQNFMSDFNRDLNQTYKDDQQYYKNLYEILLNLYGTQYYDEYLRELEPYTDDISKKYKEEIEISNKLRQKPRSYEYLKNLLKERKIEFQENYYDGFYFDFAIPSQKKAIVLMSYENYIFPEMKEKQSSLIPKRYLEKKGWKVYNIPYFAWNSLKLAEYIDSVLVLTNPMIAI